MNFAFHRPCWLTVITHSSIAMLLIWLMKPNVFELCVPIGKVAMLGGYHDVVKLCARGVFLFHVGYGKLKTLGRKMCMRTYVLRNVVSLFIASNP